MAQRMDNAGTPERSVLVVHSSRLFREGLGQLLASLKFTVDDQHPHPDGINPESMHLAAFNVIIWGSVAGPLDATDLDRLRKLHRGTPATRIVVLGSGLSRSDMLGLLETGVDAILSEDISSEILHRSLELIMLGQCVLPARTADVLAAPRLAAPRTAVGEGDVGPSPEDQAHRPAPLPREDDGPARHRREAGGEPPLPADRRRTVAFSDREGEVLSCLAEGSSNKAIARRLDISEATVKVHVKSVLRKIQATNRTQAAVWAFSNHVNGRQNPAPEPDVPFDDVYDATASAWSGREQSSPSSG